MSQAADERTLAFYEAEAPAYSASGSQGASRALPAFLAKLAPGARILELGCGGGRDAHAMLAAGFAVDATDGCAALAAKAEERIGQPVSVMQFDALSAHDVYDGIWAHASLLHVPFGALPDIVGRIWRALKPGGWHFANFKAGSGEGRDRFGRYFNYPSREAIESVYRQTVDWQAVELSEGYGNGYDGEPTRWIGLLVQRTQQEGQL